MNKHAQIAVAGFVLLLPALILVSFGLLDLDVHLPGALVHPVLVMGGMLLAGTLNARSVLGVRVRQEGDSLVGTISIRLRGSVMNLTAVIISCLLFATITAYLFVENFQPR